MEQANPQARNDAGRDSAERLTGDGLKLGIEASTMGDAVLMLYKDGRLVDRITHIRPGLDELLPRLEGGEFEATLEAAAPVT